MLLLNMLQKPLERRAHRDDNHFENNNIKRTKYLEDVRGREKERERLVGVS